MPADDAAGARRRDGAEQTPRGRNAPRDLEAVREAALLERTRSSGGKSQRCPSPTTCAYQIYNKVRWASDAYTVQKGGQR